MYTHKYLYLILCIENPSSEDFRVPPLTFSPVFSKGGSSVREENDDNDDGNIIIMGGL
jgi:hypothetical protein